MQTGLGSRGTERRGAGRRSPPSSSSAGAGGGGRVSSPRPAARPGVRSFETWATRTPDPDLWAGSSARRSRPTPSGAERAAHWPRERGPTEPGAVSAGPGGRCGPVSPSSPICPHGLRQAPASFPGATLRGSRENGVIPDLHHCFLQPELGELCCENESK